MTTYRAGDLVDVPFPFIDSGAAKQRPALVLSASQFQRKTGAYVLTMVTSAERSRWENDVALDDWNGAGLNKPSIIRWKIFTLDETLILGYRGHVSDRDMTTLGQALAEVFSEWPLGKAF